MEGPTELQLDLFRAVEDVHELTAAIVVLFFSGDGGWNLGLNFDFGALPDDKAQRAAMKATLKGSLIAWDPVAGKARWTVALPVFWNAK